MSTIWLPTSISSEELAAEVAVLVQMLRQTRSSERFPSWDTDDVINAFSVAERTARALKTADSVQKAALETDWPRRYPKGTGVALVDRDISALLEHPVHCLVRAIFGSPILTWLHSKEQVIRASLAHAARILGKEAVGAVLAEAVKSSIAVRMQMSHARQGAASDMLAYALQQHPNPPAASASASDADIAVATDEVSLAVELLWAVTPQHAAATAASAAPVSVSASALHYKDLAREDLTCLRLLCVAASLSAATICTSCAHFTPGGISPALALAAGTRWQRVYAQSCSRWIYDCLEHCLLDAPAGHGQGQAQAQGQGLCRYLRIDPRGSLMAAIIRKAQRELAGCAANSSHSHLGTYEALYSRALLEGGRANWPAVKPVMEAYLSLVGAEQGRRPELLEAAGGPEGGSGIAAGKYGSAGALVQLLHRLEGR